MDTRDLLKIDLNLLISLQVMLEECSVSRAAQRLFITQPAMSKTLSRLRTVFDDPLFTRTSHGMRATPRALELSEDLQDILSDIQHLVAAKNFSPEQWEGEIVIALSEYIGIGVLPVLMRRLQFLAPGMRVKTISRIENQLEHLATGSLDIAISMPHAHYSDEYMLHTLGGHPPVILARQGHPLTGEDINWQLISQYSLIRLYISDLEELEFFKDWRNIAQFEEGQRGGFETTHLLTALEVLRYTDYLMPGPPFILDNPTIGYKIQSFPVPEALSYKVQYQMVRHRRTENSPIHNWLWQQLIEVINTMGTDVLL